MVITGTNDAATVSSADVTLQETDSALTTSGTLTSSDIDNADNQFQVQTNIAGTYGTFSIDADGQWTYIANESFDSLNVGQSVDDTFEVKSIDGTVSTVKVTIQGTNDAPTISGDFAKGVQEGVTDSVSGTVNIVDVDSSVITRSLRNGVLNGDTYTATGQYGSLTFNIATAFGHMCCSQAAVTHWQAIKLRLKPSISKRLMARQVETAYSRSPSR